MTPPEPTLRRATADDSEACFRLFWASITDLASRQNTPWEGTAEERWPQFTALYAFLAEHAAEWWVADDPSGDGLLGYSRSVERGGLFELSEFFVRPGVQSAGLGRRLLECAFPVGRGEVRAIIATGDVRALSRYHRADTSIQFPILGMTGPVAADAARDNGLEPERLDASNVVTVGEIERAVLGYDRGRELEWLLAQREGYLYRSDGAPAGFAFVGEARAGPIAALDPTHLPEILLHVEARSAELGGDELALEVPAPNVVAVRHLLERRYRLDPFVTFLMANRPFGRFDRFIGFAPPFVL